MHIETFLLENKNSLCVKGKAVSMWCKEKEYPHLWSERSATIDTIIVHAMSAIETNPADPYLRDELLSLFLTYGVSAHYLILRDGHCLNLVPPEKKAWHAGGSIMPPPDERMAVNNFSIGIELAGKDHTPFTEEQYTTLATLVALLKKNHPITSVLGHSEVSGSEAVRRSLRSDVKWDPGTGFDWNQLR